MDLTETNRILTIVATYDHRPVNGDLIDAWQRALTRQRVEHVFDAIHEHYERCNDAATVALTPAEVLRHTTKAAEQRLLAERRQRDQERNEAVFGELRDHRTDWEREASLEAMRAGRASLDAVLAARKLEREAS